MEIAMTRFFDSHAWNTRHRNAAAAVLRAVGPGLATGYISAELADVTVRAGGGFGLTQPQGGGVSDPDWLGGGTMPQPVGPEPT